MENTFLLLFVVFVATLAFWGYRKSIVSKRELLIDSFCFPESINIKILEKYPHLNDQQVSEVIDGLREYFHLCNIAGKSMVSMPSQVVDLAWHEFILFTRQYEKFCHKALGRFLHHTPAEAMKSPTAAQSGIKTAWKISCFREKIQPKSPHRLPPLFAIDDKLQIPDGFRYSLNCLAKGGNSFCAGHIGCGSGCGGGGDSSGCGGGCGGS